MYVLSFLVLRNFVTPP